MSKYEHVVYEWRRMFHNNMEAFEVADKFHYILRGNPDYVENRIILNVTKDTVTLTVWNDALSNVYVNWEPSYDVYEGKWVLHVEEPVPFTSGHVLERITDAE